MGILTLIVKKKNRLGIIIDNDLLMEILTVIVTKKGE